MAAWTGSEEGWVSAWKQMRMEDYMATSMVDLAKPELCSPFLQLGIPSSGPRSTPEYPCKWEDRLVVEPPRSTPAGPAPLARWPLWQPVLGSALPRPVSASHPAPFSSGEAAGSAGPKLLAAAATPASRAARGCGDAMRLPRPGD